MARDPRRIDRILAKLGKAWKENPDLRLMQLLGNCFQDNGDRYYTEDEVVESLLSSTYSCRTCSGRGTIRCNGVSVSCSNCRGR